MIRGRFSARNMRRVMAENVEVNTTLMAPVYSADSAECNPFVHTVSKRLIRVCATFAALAFAALIAVLRRGGAR